MKQFTKLMAMLLFTAATQYSCINDADVAIPRQNAVGLERQRSPVP